MRKLRVCLLLLGFAILLTLVWRSREPSYGGRSLSRWVQGYTYSAELMRATPRDREQALRTIGTKAVPYLLAWIRYDTPAWKTYLYGAVNPVLARIRASWTLSDVNDQLRADGAMFALIELSGEARAALPALSAIATDPSASTRVKTRAMNVLQCIDPRFWKDSSRMGQLYQF